MNYPPGAVVEDMTNNQFAHKWYLETLINELLTSPKQQTERVPYKYLNCRQFEAFRKVYNAERSLENAEDGLRLNPDNILAEMPRIGHREFEWQQGWSNKWNLYRSAYLYCGPVATEWFEAQHGLSPTNFVLAGWAAYASALATPDFPLPLAAPDLGLTEPIFRSAAHLMSLPIGAARTEAATLRRLSKARTAYKPSILRRYPCFSFNDGARLIAPIPVLVLARVTTGLFYDLVKAGGAVSRETGSRFELYCRDLLEVTFPDIECRPEATYLLGGQERLTPDAMLYQDGACVLAVECKARRMSMGARYGEDPLADAAQGFAELAKGVLQTWRYFAHVRLGHIAGHQVAPEASGLVLTLDPWVRMSRHRHTVIIADAHKLADEEGGIEAADRRPVAFCAVDDFEVLASHCTWDSFLATVRGASETERAGFLLATLHRNQFYPDPPVVRAYPFLARLADVLPWWV